MNAVERMVEELRRRKVQIAAMESCTGGAFANAVTDVPGASEILKASFVTYSNDAKIKLGVPKQIVDRFTVYSPETAKSMADAALEADVGAPWIGVGITGSLTRQDPANPANSVPGKVWAHVATWFRRGDQFVDVALTLDVDGADRKKGKAQVVEAVAEAVLKILEAQPS